MNEPGSGEIPGQNPDREQVTPDVTPAEETPRQLTPEESQRAGAIVRNVKEDNLEEATRLMGERNAALKLVDPSYTLIDPAAFTPEMQAGFIHQFSQPGLGREAAAFLNLDPEVLRVLLMRIPKAADIHPEAAPDAAQTEAVSTQPTDIEQLRALRMSLPERDSIEDVLESLPEQLQATYKKPLEEVLKIDKAEKEGQEITPEGIEAFKKVLVDSDMSLEAAEVFLVGTNLPEDAKNQIRAEIAEKQKGKPAEEDTEGVTEAADEARQAHSQANGMVDSLPPADRETFRAKLAILKTRLDDAGATEGAARAGKGVLVVLIALLLLQIFLMQLIGRASKKK